jgi:hypothetical protein
MWPREWLLYLKAAVDAEFIRTADVGRYASDASTDIA